MAVTRRPGRQPLQALMMAAAALPGMTCTPAIADGGQETRLQLGHYEENGRSFWAGPTGQLAEPDPLRADTLRADTRFALDETTSLTIDLLQDTWSGATPYITAPEGFIDTSTGASAFIAADRAAASARVDRRTLLPLNLQGTPLVKKPALVNLMTAASAETRQEGRFTLERSWEDVTLDLTAGRSQEPDFVSNTLGSSATLDVDRKLTTIGGGASYTRSRVDADLGPANSYVDYSLYTHGDEQAHIVMKGEPGLVAGQPDNHLPHALFRGEREDVTGFASLTRITGKNTTVSATVNVMHSEGMLENPHKLVTLGFANPQTPPAFDYLFTTLFAVPENRPDSREQWSLNTHVAHYLPDANAALQVDYTASRDNWDIRSQAIDITWLQTVQRDWTVTPHYRHYTQEAAGFYQPYFLFRQAYPQSPQDPAQLDYRRIPLSHWSSDQRLSAFDADSYGITITRVFDNRLALDLAYENYQHRNNDEVADFNGKTVSIGLRLMVDTAPGRHHDLADKHASHHAGHTGQQAPAGVMYGHMMQTPGDLMVEYSYHHSRQQGDLRHGSGHASDASALASCGQQGCPATPDKMTMQMQMLHVMYAATDSINLMLMPQLVSMDMDNRLLAGGFYTPAGGHNHGDMDLSGHSSGGYGDTTVAVLLQGIRGQRHSLHAGLGLSIPTGSVEEKMPSHDNALLDYGMQTGSGTWDWLPSITYLGNGDGGWSWGAQLSGIARGQGTNDSGYRLGNVAQATVWGSYRPNHWFTWSLRGLHTTQGNIRGHLAGSLPRIDASGAINIPRAQHNTTDIRGNYGGQFTDVGLGLNVAIPGREQHGDSLGVEWLQPVHDRVNGYQPERQGSLTLRWKMLF